MRGENNTCSYRLVEGNSYAYVFLLPGTSQYDEGMKALSEMERTQQVEAIQSYNDMKGDTE